MFSCGRMQVVNHFVISVAPSGVGRRSTLWISSAWLWKHTQERVKSSVQVDVWRDKGVDSVVMHRHKRLNKNDNLFVSTELFLDWQHHRIIIFRGHPCPARHRTNASPNIGNRPSDVFATYNRSVKMGTKKGRNRLQAINQELLVIEVRNSAWHFKLEYLEAMLKLALHQPFIFILPWLNQPSTFIFLVSCICMHQIVTPHTRDQAKTEED